MRKHLPDEDKVFGLFFLNTRVARVPIHTRGNYNANGLFEERMASTRVRETIYYYNTSYIS